MKDEETVLNENLSVSFCLKREGKRQTGEADLIIGKHSEAIEHQNDHHFTVGHFAGAVAVFFLPSSGNFLIFLVSSSNFLQKSSVIQKISVILSRSSTVENVFVNALIFKHKNNKTLSIMQSFFLS
jgi:hypothetical protein